jgi:cytochrome P450
MGACEATAAVMDGYCCEAMLTVLGLPPDDQVQSFVYAASAGDERPVITHLLKAAHDLAEERSSAPHGILWGLFAGLDCGDASPLLSEEDVLGLLPSIFVAGMETLSAANWFALLHLARDPQLRAKLRANPGQIPASIEDVIRLDTPAPAVPRSTTHEVVVGDVSIPAGSQVWMCLEAASREDSGAGRRHWGFGGGIHRCLGAFVARLELATLVAEWLRRIPDFEVAPGFAPSIVHEPRGLTRLEALPLRWDSTVTARMGAS